MKSAEDSNSIIAYLKDNNEALFNKIVKALSIGKSVDFTAIRQSDIIVVSPQKAFEYAGEEGDKYFKVWMVGNRIAWCTWANTMLDSQFRWNAKARDEKKRDNADLLGNEPYVSAYLKSNSAIERCSVVYMFPFDAFSDAQPKRSLKERTPQDKQARQVAELLKTLASLSPRIASEMGDKSMQFFMQRNRTNFDNTLMQLKCLDETNKMIPYYEQMAQHWDEQMAQMKKKKGLSFVEKLIDIFGE